MKRLDVLQVLLLGGWLSAAILVATIVSPAAFRVLPTRSMAGAVVGQVLPAIFVSGLLIAIAAWWLEWRAHGSFTSDRIFMIGLIAITFGCASAQFTVSPKIEHLRASVGGTIDVLSVQDPRRVRFGRLHGVSVALMGAAMVGAGTAITRKFLSASARP